MMNDGTKQDNGLPAGWVWTTLGEVADLMGGGTPTREVPEYFAGDIVWLTPTEIPKVGVTVVRDSKERITEEALRRSSARLVPEGSVLMTSRASIGYVAVAGTDLTTNQGFASFVPREGVDNFYLAYWLRANTELFLQHATGTTFKEITKSKLRPLAFPLAPLPEQHRIVAEIETQFSRLDAGVAALKRAQGNLRRYKAAVLKAACEGRLVPTEAELARGEGRAYESGSTLLARILAERRAQWERANPGKRYVEPKAPAVDGLAELPEGWMWATVEQLSWDAGYGTSQKCGYDVKGPPVIRIPNLVNGSISTADLKYATQPDELRQENSLAANDLLIIRTNGSKALIGRSALVRQRPESEFFFASYLIRYRLLNIGGTARWSAAIWDSALLRRQIEQVAATTAGQYNVSVRVLNRLAIPLPPLAEQHRIVAEVERRLSVAQEVEGVVAASLRRAERLRQSILKRGFEGRL